MSKSKYADYLGDSVYADFDGHGIILTTENGIEASNTIVLEPSVLQAFARYQERLGHLLRVEIDLKKKAESFIDKNTQPN